MTQETLPRFDLYGELEVSPFASVGTIEAAYRSLVKQHHPDVASGDEARMRRLNLAREWLTDFDRRRRYDLATDRGRHVSMAPRSVVTRSAVAKAQRRRGSGSGSTNGPDSDGDEPTFGIHGADVHQFLAELRSLDRARAQRVWNGRAVAHAKGYTQALRAAASAARPERRAEWQFAREAAGVIARGKLGDSTLTDQVADVLSDVAGAIAIRDLLSPAEFSLILLPWTWRGTVRLPEFDANAAAPVDRPDPAAKPPPTEAEYPRIEPVPLVLPPKPADAQPPGTPPASAKVGRAAAFIETGPVSVTLPAVDPDAAVDAEPGKLFVPVARPSTEAPSWPEEPAEPRARPPIDPSIPAGLAAIRAKAQAAAPVPSGTAFGPPVIRQPPSPPKGIRAAVFAPPPRRPVGVLPLALAAVSLVLLVGAALVLLPGSKPSQNVGAATDVPSATIAGVAFESQPLASTEPSIGQAPTAQPSPGTSTAGAGIATAKPTPARATPKPTRAPTPRPTGTPTPPPTPAPTPKPTATPELCKVPNLIGVRTSDVAALWGTGAGGAGFTGPITYIPKPPPQYKVAWQSLAAGTFEPCTSGIVVRKAAL